MAADGKVIIETLLDSSEFEKGVAGLKAAAENGTKAIAGAFTAVSAALGTMATAAIAAGSGFEAQMSTVEALSSASKQEVNVCGEIVNGFDAVSAKAKEIGATTSLSATQSAQALEYMALAGWSAQDMYDGLAGVASLAAASGEDLALASDILTDAITAFGDSAKDANRYADVLAQTSASANTDVAGLGEAFKYAGAACGTLGIDMEDAAFAIGLMANAGVKGSQAGTSLRAGLVNLVKPTKQMRDAMAKYGVAIQTSEDGNVDLMATIEMLRDRLGGLDAATEAAAIAAIFGKEAMSGWAAVVDASDEDFAKLSQSIAESEGSAKRMSEVKLDNLQGQITLLQSAAESLGIAVYEQAEKPLKNLAADGQEYIARLYNAFETSGFDGLAGEIGSVFADIAIYIAQQIPTLIQTAQSVIQSFCDEIVQNGDTLFTAGASVVGSVVNGLLSTAGTIATTAIALIGIFVENLIANGPSLMQSGTDLLLELTNGIMNGMQSLTDIGIELITALASGVAEAVPAFLETALPMLVEFTGQLRENAGQLIDAGLELIVQLAKGIVDSIPTLVENVPLIITNIAGVINDNAPKLLATAAEVIWMFVTGLLKNIPVIVANIPQIIAAIVDVFLAFNWVNMGKSIIEAFANGIKNMASAAGQAGKSILTSIKNALGTLVGWLQQIATEGVSGLASVVGKLAGTVVRAFMSLFGGIQGAMANLPKFLLDLAKNAITKFIGAFTSGGWKNVGKNVIDGIVSGITGAIGGLVSSAAEAAQSALNSAKKALGIKSPSRKFRDEVGKYIPAGVAVGIEENASVAEDAMDDLSDQLVSDAEGLQQSLADQMEAAVRAETGRNPTVRFHSENVYTEMLVGAKEQYSSLLARIGENNDERFSRYEESTKRAITETLSKVEVKIDGKPAGKLLAPYIDKALPKPT